MKKHVLFCIALTAGLSLALFADDAPAKRKPVAYVPPTVLTPEIYSYPQKPGNLYYPGDTVKLKLKIDNGRKEPATGKFTLTLQKPDGSIETLESKDKCTIKGNEELVRNLEFKPKTYGGYQVKAVFEAPSRTFEAVCRFAVIHKANKLNMEQKLASPWGINVHGGYANMNMQIIADIGPVWARDFAYGWGWINNARGEQGDYRGWPWYPQMYDRTVKAGLLLLPTFQGSIAKAGTPDDFNPKGDWVNLLIGFAQKFPCPAYELDNEYNLRNTPPEEVNNWQHYGAVHRQFGKAFKNAGIKALISGEGAAGLNSERMAMMVKRGDFNDLDVVNGHHYCGPTAPELSCWDANAHGEFVASKNFALFFDVMRDFVAAASCDGKKRQTWITEFGWDTLAGHPVTEREQAAYCQRGYMICLLAGIDRVFWYWHYDAEGVVTTFFGGCGVFDPNVNAKPITAAYSWMAKNLVNPKVRGDFYPAENAMGYIVEDNRKLYALVFQRDPGLPAPKLKLSGQLTDMFGNALAAGEHQLEVAPIWMLNLDSQNPFVRQADYDLASKYMDTIAAGDKTATVLRFTNRGHKTLSAEYEALPPKGWIVENPTGVISADSGKTATVDIRYQVPLDASDGMYDFPIKVTENGNTKIIPYRVMLTKTASIKIAPFDGEPGKPVEVNISLRNNSLSTRSFLLKPELPKTWKSDPKSIEVKDVPPKSSREASLMLSWSPDWKAGESAAVGVYDLSGQKISDDLLVPPALQIPKVANIVNDGDFSDWPAEAKMPEWAIGCTRGNVKPEIYLGYSDDGLHYALKVPDSKVHNPDPTWFWQQDCLELFIDTKNVKSERPTYAETDHQFWLVPLPEEKRVYVGRWANGEIEETVYDIPTPSFSKKTGDGYIIEGVIPIAQLKGADFKPGSMIGLNLNCMVKSLHEDYEIFWKNAKRSSPQKKQQIWGTLLLK